MRKDVRFGFAIGGILLAVVIVYVLVVPSTNTNDQVSVVGEEAPAVNVTAPAPQPRTSEIPPTDVVPMPDSATVRAETPAPERAVTPAGGDEAYNWDGLLKGTERLPAMMTSTPVPGGSQTPAASSTGTQTPAASTSHENPAAATFNNSSQAPSYSAYSAGSYSSPSSRSETDQRTTPSYGSGSTSSNNTSSDSAVVASSTELPSDSISGTRKHVVQSGETFSSIAAETYGSANYWSHIQRANPTLDPKAIRPGMTINLPDPAAIKSAASTPETPHTPAPVNASTEYRVQPGDSLYKISVKLYGKADHVEDLHAWNRDLIGADPAHLKVNSILKLQEPPTVTASSR
jgi:nucleoid-associated protein YgaU